MWILVAHDVSVLLAWHCQGVVSEWGVCVGVCSPPASLPLFFSVTVVVFVALITVGVGSLALFPSTVFQCDCCCFCCPCYCRRWFPSTVFQWDCCCFWCPYYCRRWFPSTVFQWDCCCFCCPYYCRRWFPSTVFQWDCCCFCYPYYCRRWFPSTVFQWDCCCFCCPYYCRRWFPCPLPFHCLSVWLLFFCCCPYYCRRWFPCPLPFHCFSVWLLLFLLPLSGDGSLALFSSTVSVCLLLFLLPLGDGSLILFYFIYLFTYLFIFHWLNQCDGYLGCVWGLMAGLPRLPAKGALCFIMGLGTQPPYPAMQWLMQLYALFFDYLILLFLCDELLNTYNTNAKKTFNELHADIRQSKCKTEYMGVAAWQFTLLWNPVFLGEQTWLHRVWTKHGLGCGLPYGLPQN